jgi:acetyltransferase-like isoleucine patch superfamily enzyme
MPDLLQRLKHPVVRLLSVFTGPRIVYGWRNTDGSWCAHTRVSTHACFEGTEGLTLGDHVFIGHFNRVDGSNGLVIEEGVQVTSHAAILSHSSHRAVRVMGRRYAVDSNPLGYVRRATRIGAYSFIGPHSVIAPGSRLGKGVIVQAYSFVSGEVPDFAILGPQAHGKPAVVVGDSREMDRPLLQRHPELHHLYAHWAGRDNLRRALQGGGSEQEPA